MNSIGASKIDDAISLPHRFGSRISEEREGARRMAELSIAALKQLEENPALNI